MTHITINAMSKQFKIRREYSLEDGWKQTYWHLYFTLKFNEAVLCPVTNITYQYANTIEVRTKHGL